MLEVNRFYCQDRSFGLYLIATPIKRIGYGDAEDLFALEMVEVLTVLDLLPPRPVTDRYYSPALEEWFQLRNQAILKYGIQNKLIARINCEDNPFIPASINGSVLVNFRYLACIDGVLPASKQTPLFNLLWHVEDCIRRYGRAIDKFLQEKGMTFVRYQEDGQKEEHFSPPTACLAEYARVIQTASLKGSIENAANEVGFCRMRGKDGIQFIKEAELAKEVGMTQVKFRQCLVDAGFLVPVQNGLKTCYEPSRKGCGYCDTSKGRMWHRSVLALLSHAG